VSLLVGFSARAGAQRLDGFTTLTLRSNARGPAGTNPDPPDLEIGDGGQLTATWVEWTAPDVAPPVPVRFWVVLRETDAGTAWIERSAVMTP